MKRMSLAGLLLCLATPLGAQDASNAVVVRESVDPATGAVIGQHVALRVDVLFRGDMPYPPRVSLPDVPGLQTLRFETQATTLRETIAGETYGGQRFEFALYARRGGTFTLPPASVTLLDRQGNVTGTTKGQAVSVAVSVPPRVDASGPVVATRALTLQEQWSPNAQAVFKPGDAIVRTITRTAEDVPGLAIRDLDFAAPDGVRAYVDPPEIDDHVNRGVVTGRRVDRVTYVFERGGRIQLPAVTQPWWDLAAGTVRSARAAGAILNVTEASLGQTTSGGTSRTWLPFTTVGTIVIVILGAAGLHLLRRRQAMGDRAEQDAFIALRRACSTENAEAVYRAFSRWRLFLDPTKRKSVTQAAAALDVALFAGSASTWSGADSQDLITKLASLRTARSHVARFPSLPPLNPGGKAASNETSS